MRLELLILVATGFFILNIYHDGKYITLIKTWKKYYQMAFYAFLGLSLYIFVKKYPSEGKNLFSHANSFIKYMPIDKDTTDMISPFFGASSYLYKNAGQSGYGQSNIEETPQYKRMLQSGGHNQNQNQTQGNNNNNVRASPTTTKRCVGETKKKFIAANQSWKCAHCSDQLTAWFEVDHKVRLDRGGDNHVNNLEALCRNCHGKKTSMESML